MNDLGILRALQAVDKDIFERLHLSINAAQVVNILRPIANTPAPSQSVKYTRAGSVEEFLASSGILHQPNVEFSRDFHQTGNSVILLGGQRRSKKVWLLAHLDIISYFVERKTSRGYSLLPFCYHLMEPGRQQALALRFNWAEMSYELAAQGEILTEEGGQIHFLTEAPAQLRPGHRICFNSSLDWDQQTGLLAGSLDDAGGAASLLAALSFLVDYDVELMVALTDEEEGTDGSGNQTICRGGARLLPFFDQPALVISVDLHEASPMREGSGPKGLKPGDGACFAEKASRGRGEVTPPHLYELLRQLSTVLDSQGIRLRENAGGYIGRSEGTNAMLRTPNVAILGFLGENRHFDRGPTTSNAHDLVDLAKTVACLALLVHSPFWKEVFQG